MDTETPVDINELIRQALDEILYFATRILGMLILVPVSILLGLEPPS